MQIQMRNNYSILNPDTVINIKWDGIRIEHLAVLFRLSHVYKACSTTTSSY